MSRSSDRGQTEPIAALLAVLVVGAGLALYADVLTDSLDHDPQRNVAAATLERVEGHLSPEGVVDPARLASLGRVTPDGYGTNVTLIVDGQSWSFGPAPGHNVDRASRTVSVRTAPVSVESGQLRVVTWK